MILKRMSKDARKAKEINRSFTFSFSLFLSFSLSLSPSLSLFHYFSISLFLFSFSISLFLSFPVCCLLLCRPLQHDEARQAPAAEPEDHGVHGVWVLPMQAKEPRRRHPCGADEDACTPADHQPVVAGLVPRYPLEHQRAFVIAYMRKKRSKEKKQEN